MVRLFHTPLHTYLIALEFNKKNTWHKCGKSADKEYALGGSKDAHTHSLTHSQSHMGHSINELAVLMSAVEWMFTATLKPSALINTLSFCSVMRQPYDFTYPRPWSESLQTGDSDELIIPLSCNYPPPPSPSFSLSLSLLIRLFPSQSLLSFVYSSPLLTQFLFISVNLSPSRTHTSLFLSTPSSLYTNIYDYTSFVISILFLLCIYLSLYISNLLPLCLPPYRGTSGRLKEWEYSMCDPWFI